MWVNLIRVYAAKAIDNEYAYGRLLVEYVYGICPKCLLNKKRKTLREASLLLGLTEDGAEKKLKKILNKLKKSLEE